MIGGRQGGRDTPVGAAIRQAAARDAKTRRQHTATCRIPA